MPFAPLALSLCWGFDTDTKLTLASARALREAPYPASPRRFVIRYVSLGAPAPSDITKGERDAIFAAGWEALGLVQHVPYPEWHADAASGARHGAAAVAHAQLVEYPVGCHLALDIEGVGTPGAPIYDYLGYASDAVHKASLKTLGYDGYSDGLTFELKDKLVRAGIIDDWWSDFGPRALPAGQRFVLKQHAEQTVGGTRVDGDQVLVPGVVFFMAPSLVPAPTPGMLAEEAAQLATEDDVAPADRTTQPELPES